MAVILSLAKIGRGQVNQNLNEAMFDVVLRPIFNKAQNHVISLAKKPIQIRDCENQSTTYWFHCSNFSSWMV
ncbi:hypothetical protein VNO77_05335 [Canavalia gladiata]|uniref:Uncharacterized protein n=2 Tax=Canavalia gladiata TaxID=3824 RepID=A0AAN9R538_CANGL